MKQTVRFKLVLTPAQQRLLLETMHAFNAACNAIGEQVFAAQTTNIFALQERTAGMLHEQFRLPPRLAFQAIFTTCERYKRRQQVKPVFQEEEAIVVDEQIASFHGLTRISLLTIAGRMLVPFLIQRARLQRARRATRQTAYGQATLQYGDGQFFLEVTLESSSAVIG